MYALSVVVAALPIVALARGFGSPESAAHHRRANAVKARASNYGLVDHWEGKNFFDGWYFFSGQDPTNGKVNYLTREKAMNGTKPLAYVQNDNTVVMAVDDWSVLGDGQNRDSVRINTEKQYNQGLFIADFFSMPHGCSVWPAWWSSGPNWPDDGEMDIVEGVNLGQYNQYTLHTGSACNLQKSSATGNKAFTGNLMGTTCTSSQTSNAGCAISDTRNTSFGHGFNMVAGGVFAHEWTDSGVKMWFFERSEIPADIYSQTPNPGSWPSPVADFAMPGCDMSKAFKDQSLTFDITVCGGWAESAYSQNSGCPGSCSDAVKDPANFKYAKWEIKSVSVYQQK